MDARTQREFMIMQIMLRLSPRQWDAWMEAGARMEAGMSAADAGAAMFRRLGHSAADARAKIAAVLSGDPA